MTADELRELANAIEPMACAPRFDGLDMPALTAYLRACADAMDAGPVAWRYWNEKSRSWNETSSASVAAAMQEGGRSVEPLYPLAMPAQAQALRLPEPMTDEEVAALIDETEYLPTDHAVRYLVETGECRVKEANE